MKLKVSDWDVFHIYIWIRDAFDKSSRFTENSFVPNLRSTLIEYGHVKTPSIRIHQNIDIGNGNRLLKVTTDDKLKYFVVTYDGSRINAEITKEQYNKFFEGQPSQKTEK